MLLTSKILSEGIETCVEIFSSDILNGLTSTSLYDCINVINISGASQTGCFAPLHQHNMSV